VEVEVVPEPDPEDREALLAALSGSFEPDEPSPYRSPWRRAALELEDDQD
jgi:hypothetical protein